MNRCFLILLTAAIGLSCRAAYKIDSKIGKDKLGEISQLAIDRDNAVCALELNGKITCFQADGSVKSVIETGLENTTAFTVSPNGNFLVFSTQTEMKKIKSGARMRTVAVSVGVEMAEFDPAGKKITARKLPQLTSAKAAKLVNGKLVVADLSANSLVFLDPETGEETARVKKELRLCCGIFDFCTAPDNTVAVSNLGAFKVQRFDTDGNLVSEFGKRGRDLNDFQGCCNPVSAAYLPDNRILTVEKDPTRIKIYDADGKNAVQIKGVEELVQGCSFIPSAVDQNGNIYLAANTKGYIVKCAP